MEDFIQLVANLSQILGLPISIVSIALTIAIWLNPNTSFPAIIQRLRPIAIYICTAASFFMIGIFISRFSLGVGLENPFQFLDSQENDLDLISTFEGSINSYSGIMDPSFNAGFGRISIIEGKKTSSAYEFQYILPEEGNAYANFAFQFSSAQDFTAYKYLKTTISFSDSESQCDIYIRDSNTVARYIRLGGPESINGVGIIKEVNENEQIYTIPLNLNFDGSNKREITEIGFSVNSNFIRGAHSCTIHSIKLMK